jgi:hypothetical protein
MTKSTKEGMIPASVTEPVTVAASAAPQTPVLNAAAKPPTFNYSPGQYQEHPSARSAALMTPTMRRLASHAATPQAAPRSSATQRLAAQDVEGRRLSPATLKSMARREAERSKAVGTSQNL